MIRERRNDDWLEFLRKLTQNIGDKLLKVTHRFMQIYHELSFIKDIRET